MKDTSSVRNGLFLASNVEKAFDRLQLSFIKSSPLSDMLVLKIWDDSCRDTPIWTGHETTIGDLDGQELVLGSHRPYKRALSYHACQAYLRNNIDGVPPIPYGTPNAKQSQVASELCLLRGIFDRHVEEEVEDDEGMAEETQGELDEDTASSTHKTPKTKSAGGRCFRCKKRGHVKKNCPGKNL
jgi:hypothetical protein